MSLLCGAIEFGEPLEDTLRGLRAQVSAHDASGQIVVVGIDEKTRAQLGSFPFSRRFDAQAIDRLFKLGAKRVFYDKYFADRTDRAGDQAFEQALQRHPGKVFLGAFDLPADEGRPAKHLESVQALQEVARMASMVIVSTPFSIGVRVPYSSSSSKGTIRSISAEMADLSKPPTALFRPDLAIRASSIPTISFSDVVADNIMPNQIAGKDIVIGAISPGLHDNHKSLAQGLIPGCYYHVIAAETLKRGTPIDLAWTPSFALGLALAAISLFSKQMMQRRLALIASAISFGILPLVLDRLLINVDVVPGLLVFAIAASRGVRIRRTERSAETNSVSGLPNFSALRSGNHHRNETLVVTKITNFAEITASFAQSVERELVLQVTRGLHIAEPDLIVYHSEQTIAWFTPLPMSIELIDHIEGLNNISNRVVQIAGRNIDLSLSFGIDSDAQRSITSRLGSALLAAEEAADSAEIWKLYDPQRQHEAAFQLSLLSRLDQAIDDGEVWVAFQPKLDLARNTIASAEALVRWNHPERGLIGPDAFIGAAETHHRMEKLTLFVLDESIRIAAEINASGIDFGVAVNLSTHLLQLPGLLPLIESALARHGLPADKLTLEITETGKLDCNPTTLRMMDTLAENGLRVSLDDYGTGNATIDYLRLVPSHEVKIDKSFVTNIDSNAQDLAIVRSTIDVAHSLGRTVVAEGVETIGVLDTLRRLGCDTAQGYYIGRPILASAFARNFIRQRRKASRTSVL